MNQTLHIPHGGSYPNNATDFFIDPQYNAASGPTAAIIQVPKTGILQTNLKMIMMDIQLRGIMLRLIPLT